MDTIKATVTEDALGKDVKHSASASACEMNSAEKLEKKTSLDTENQKKAAAHEERDDLLEKIEEVVRDKVTSESLENDISQSSEHDFIKQIEEMENEVKEAKQVEDPKKDQESVEECDSEKVIVGKLVMEVSSTDEKSEKSEENDSNVEKSNDLSSVSVENSEPVTRSETDKNEATELENGDEGRTKAECGEISDLRKEKYEGDETKETGKKDKEENSEEVTSSDDGPVLESRNTEDNREKDPVNECSVSPDTKNESILPPTPSISKEKSVEIKEQVETSENISNKKPASENVEEVSESIKSTTELAVTDKVQETGELQSQAIVSEELPSESERKGEPMSVDLCDPLIEPMEVDSEEKMDVDPESVCEENDQEMIAAEELNKAEDKLVESTTEKLEATKSTESTQPLAPIEISETDQEKPPEVKINEKETSQVEEKDKSIRLDASAKVDANEDKQKEVEIRNLQSKDAVKASEQKPESSEKLSPSTNSVSISGHKISESTKDLNSAALERGIEQKKELVTNLPASKPPSKETAEVQSKQASCTSGEILPTKDDKVVEKDRPATAITKKVSEQKHKLESKKDEKGVECDSTVKEKQSPHNAKVADVKVAKDEYEERQKEEKEIVCKKNIESEKEAQSSENTEGVKVIEDKAKAENKKPAEIGIVEEKDMKSKDQQIPKSTSGQIEEQRSSGSTASLSSTTDEQIIKFGMETTLPGVDVEEEPQQSRKVENKPLINMMKHGGSTPSLDTTPVTTPNVFNSTPIQKQFEISSENVSKISEAIETSRTEKTVEDDANLNKSSKPEYSTESGTCTSK